MNKDDTSKPLQKVTQFLSVSSPLLGDPILLSAFIMEVWMDKPRISLFE